MRILLCHNRYQQPGGEDAAFEAERQLLRQSGHEVFTYLRSNDELKEAGLRGALSALWSWTTWREIRRAIDEYQPDVLHCHNTHAVISPSVYWAAWSKGLPVVQTLHNYRLICPNALLLRSGRPCQLCVGRKFAWPGVRYACYRSSRSLTAVLALTVWIHRQAGTWSGRIAKYVALTEFARRCFVKGGLPEGKLAVVSGFTTGVKTGGGVGGPRYVLYMGRLSEEKGIRTLLAAWRRLPDVPLRIAGDGPLAELVRAFAEQYRTVTYLGWQARDTLRQTVLHARFVVVPSICYEGFPAAIVESMACGIPVVVSRTGGLPEIVTDARQGFLFDAGDPRDLAAKVEHAWSLDAAGYDEMRRECLGTQRALYSETAHMRALGALYESVTDRRTNGS